MSNKQGFGLLRRVLRGLGLTDRSSEKAVDFIDDLLKNNDNVSSQKPQSILPYHLRDEFLSPAELKFYRILRRIVHKRAHLVTKVNLNDIFYVKSSDFSDFRTYTNKIDRKHVDFLICDWKTLQPIIAIELDDKSHSRKDRQERDKFVDSVFATANLPILHIKVKREYDIKKIARTLSPYLNYQTKAQPIKANLEAQYEVQQSKECPKCGADMVLRTAQKGENAGNQFWGCSTYPKCRSIVQVEATLI